MRNIRTSILAIGLSLLLFVGFAKADDDPLEVEAQKYSQLISQILTQFQSTSMWQNAAQGRPVNQINNLFIANEIVNANVTQVGAGEIEIRMFRGLFEFAGSVDQIAYVLAHELGHYFYGHTEASQLDSAKDSQKNEYEADHFALMLMTEAGYVSEQAAILWERMISRHKSRSKPFENFIASHPSGFNRAYALRGHKVFMNNYTTEGFTPLPYSAADFSSSGIFHKVFAEHGGNMEDFADYAVRDIRDIVKNLRAELPEVGSHGQNVTFILSQSINELMQFIQKHSQHFSPKDMELLLTEVLTELQRVMNKKTVHVRNQEVIENFFQQRLIARYHKKLVEETQRRAQVARTTPEKMYEEWKKKQPDEFKAPELWSECWQFVRSQINFLNPNIDKGLETLFLNYFLAKDVTKLLQQVRNLSSLRKVLQVIDFPSKSLGYLSFADKEKLWNALIRYLPAQELVKIMMEYSLLPTNQGQTDKRLDFFSLNKLHAISKTNYLQIQNWLIGLYSNPNVGSTQEERLTIIRSIITQLLEYSFIYEGRKTGGQQAPQFMIQMLLKVKKHFLETYTDQYTFEKLLELGPNLRHFVEDVEFEAELLRKKGIDLDQYAKKIIEEGEVQGADREITKLLTLAQRAGATILAMSQDMVENPITDLGAKERKAWTLIQLFLIGADDMNIQFEKMSENQSSRTRNHNSYLGGSTSTLFYKVLFSLLSQSPPSIESTRMSYTLFKAFTKHRKLLWKNMDQNRIDYIFTTIKYIGEAQFKTIEGNGTLDQHLQSFDKPMDKVNEILRIVGHEHLISYAKDILQHYETHGKWPNYREIKEIKKKNNIDYNEFKSNFDIENPAYFLAAKRIVELLRSDKNLTQAECDGYIKIFLYGEADRKYLWFNNNTESVKYIFDLFLERIKREPLDEIEKIIDKEIDLPVILDIEEKNGQFELEFAQKFSDIIMSKVTDQSSWAIAQQIFGEVIRSITRHATNTMAGEDVATVFPGSIFDGFMSKLLEIIYTEAKSRSYISSQYSKLQWYYLLTSAFTSTKHIDAPEKLVSCSYTDKMLEDMIENKEISIEELEKIICTKASTGMYRVLSPEARHQYALRILKERYSGDKDKGIEFIKAVYPQANASRDSLLTQHSKNLEITNQSDADEIEDLYTAPGSGGDQYLGIQVRLLELMKNLSPEKKYSIMLWFNNLIDLQRFQGSPGHQALIDILNTINASERIFPNIDAIKQRYLSMPKHAKFILNYAMLVGENGCLHDAHINYRGVLKAQFLNIAQAPSIIDQLYRSFLDAMDIVEFASFFSDILPELASYQDKPAKLAKRVFTSFGIVGFKAMQILSEQAGLIPDEFREEFGSAKENARPIPIVVALKWLNEYLKNPEVRAQLIALGATQIIGKDEVTWEDVFVIEKELGNASIKVVLKARFKHNDQPIVIKLRRNGVVEEVEQDLIKVKRFVDGLRANNSNSQLIPLFESLIQQLESSFNRELYFVNEWVSRELLNKNANQRRARGIEIVSILSTGGAQDVRIKLPEIFLFTDELVLEEEAKEISISDEQKLEELGMSPEKVAKAIITHMMLDLFVSGFADPDRHGGNFFARYLKLVGQTELYIIDFGQAFSFSWEARKNLIRFFRSIRSEDSGKISKAWLAMVSPKSLTSQSIQDFTSKVSEYVEKAKLVGNLDAGKIFQFLMYETGMRHWIYADSYVDAFKLFTSLQESIRRASGKSELETKYGLSSQRAKLLTECLTAIQEENLEKIIKTWSAFIEEMNFEESEKLENLRSKLEILSQEFSKINSKDYITYFEDTWALLRESIKLTSTTSKIQELMAHGFSSLFSMARFENENFFSKSIQAAYILGLINKHAESLIDIVKQIWNRLWGKNNKPAKPTAKPDPGKTDLPSLEEEVKEFEKLAKELLDHPQRLSERGMRKKLLRLAKNIEVSFGDSRLYRMFLSGVLVPKFQEIYQNYEKYRQNGSNSQVRMFAKESGKFFVALCVKEILEQVHFMLFNDNADIEQVFEFLGHLPKEMLRFATFSGISGTASTVLDASKIYRMRTVQDILTEKLMASKESEALARKFLTEKGGIKAATMMRAYGNVIIRQQILFVTGLSLNKLIWDGYSKDFFKQVFVEFTSFAVAQMIVKPLTKVARTTYLAIRHGKNALQLAEISNPVGWLFLAAQLALEMIFADAIGQYFEHSFVQASAQNALSQSLGRLDYYARERKDLHSGKINMWLMADDPCSSQKRYMLEEFNEKNERNFVQCLMRDTLKQFNAYILQVNMFYAQKKLGEYIQKEKWIDHINHVEGLNNSLRVVPIDVKPTYRDQTKKNYQKYLVELKGISSDIKEDLQGHWATASAKRISEMQRAFEKSMMGLMSIETVAIDESSKEDTEKNAEMEFAVLEGMIDIQTSIDNELKFFFSRGETGSEYESEQLFYSKFRFESKNIAQKALNVGEQVLLLEKWIKFSRRISIPKIFGLMKIHGINVRDSSFLDDKDKKEYLYQLWSLAMNWTQRFDQESVSPKLFTGQALDLKDSYVSPFILRSPLGYPKFQNLIKNWQEAFTYTNDPLRGFDPLGGVETMNQWLVESLRPDANQKSELLVLGNGMIVKKEATDIPIHYEQIMDLFSRTKSLVLKKDESPQTSYQLIVKDIISSVVHELLAASDEKEFKNEITFIKNLRQYALGNKDEEKEQIDKKKKISIKAFEKALLIREGIYKAFKSGDLNLDQLDDFYTSIAKNYHNMNQPEISTLENKNVIDLSNFSQAQNMKPSDPGFAMAVENELQELEENWGSHAYIYQIYKEMDSKALTHPGNDRINPGALLRPYGTVSTLDPPNAATLLGIIHKECLDRDFCEDWVENQN
ncbi:MAG: M48 family metalloprotease [Bdellovibrionales bacterium]|nr:M48 family metalloprotease [Bdellovibrionales bacterium]